MSSPMLLFSQIQSEWCALSGRRGTPLRLALGALVVEGALVGANHGDCPLAGVGDRIGDRVPLFELVLPPRAARRAVPALGMVTAVGICLLAIRGRRSDATTARAHVSNHHV